MNDYKKGGGDKDQLYDKENGQYMRNEQCEKDEENLVLTKIFGINTHKPIVYPTVNVHDNDYCELIIRYCLNLKRPYLDENKIVKYLLIKKEKDDKSNFLNILGYNKNNWQELYKQLLDGTSFDKRKLSNFNEYQLTFETKTIIYDYVKNRKINITSIWNVEKDFTIRFITIIPREAFKDEN